MPIELTMPRLSDTMESGTIIRWNVKEGDEVASGDVVADVETDKATMEMQVYDDGRVERILVPEGKTVPVGTPIAVIAGDGAEPVAAVAPRAETPSAAASPAPAPAAVPTAAASTAASPATPSSASAGRGVRVSPVARRIAEEHGLDPSELSGSGPSGRVVKQDVLAAIENRRAAGSAPEPARIETAMALPLPRTAAPRALAAAGREGGEVPLSGMRQTIAKRLVESKTTIPHYQVTVRVDMDPVLAMRQELNAQLAEQEVKLSVNDFIVRAAALAMAKNPYCNASWGGDRILLHGAVNIGVAIALPEERGGGLVVATVRDADRKSLRWISEETRTLAEKARTRGLAAEEMADSTFTISNLGMFGVEHFTAIINPPNSAILACGAAIEKPVVRNGALAVGREMQATLSLDHRVIDGAMGASWLAAFKSALEHPALLLV